MDLFNVYKRWNIEPVRGQGSTLWDADGQEYLDLYGGHAVISIGHCHPHYVAAIREQIGKLGFYSNAVQNSLQDALAEKLGKISGYDAFHLFLCNSGAEANENALKLASFHTGRSKVLAFGGAFHGRTAGAVSVTDNPKIRAPFNATPNVAFVPLGDLAAAEKELSTQDYAAVIIEGIQGVAGIKLPSDSFLKDLRALCDRTGTLLVLDEIQSGCGRTGRFFAHQYAGVEADGILRPAGHDLRRQPHRLRGGHRRPRSHRGGGTGREGGEARCLVRIAACRRPRPEGIPGPRPDDRPGDQTRIQGPPGPALV